jgi:hypothetical protein
MASEVEVPSPDYQISLRSVDEFPVSRHDDMTPDASLCAIRPPMIPFKSINQSLGDESTLKPTAMEAYMLEADISCLGGGLEQRQQFDEIFSTLANR